MDRYTPINFSQRSLYPYSIVEESASKLLDLIGHRKANRSRVHNQVYFEQTDPSSSAASSRNAGGAYSTGTRTCTARRGDSSEKNT